MTRILLLFLFSFVSTSHACQLEDITIDTNFSNATSPQLLTACEINKQIITLELSPENTPINNSPWFAFKISAKNERTIRLAMKVADGKHRYQPKMSVDGKHWQIAPHTVNQDTMEISLDVTQHPIWIAAQEIITNEDYIEWGKNKAATTTATHQLIGYSTQHRPIHTVESRDTANKEWLVILGRQHPPEVTGALALFPFADELLSNSALALEFRKKYNIAIIPNLNPDGVELGYWRHNVNGTDLNRDWGKFEQKEVITVNNYLMSLVETNDKMAMAIDFHSTYKDIFYTMPSDYGVKQPHLVNNWLNALDSTLPDFAVIQKLGNNPNKGVFKQYFADQFNVHAITYEMGDNTDRTLIKTLAVTAANTLMQTMLQDNQKQH